jgi:hypothetical protein
MRKKARGKENARTRISTERLPEKTSLMNEFFVQSLSAKSPLVRRD